MMLHIELERAVHTAILGGSLLKFDRRLRSDTSLFHAQVVDERQIDALIMKRAISRRCIYARGISNRVDLTLCGASLVPQGRCDQIIHSYAYRKNEIAQLRNVQQSDVCIHICIH